MDQEYQMTEKKKRLLIALMRLNEFTVEELLDLLELKITRQTAYNWLGKDKK